MLIISNETLFDLIFDVNIYRSHQKNRPGYNIRFYWTNFWKPTVYVQQNIFDKNPLEVCSPHLYASFGTFSAQIGQLVFEVCLKIDNLCYIVIKGKCRRLQNSSECLKTHCATKILPIWTKRCKKKRKDTDYKLLLEFFQKYFVLHERWAIKISFSAYVCYTLDFFFWLNL